MCVFFSAIVTRQGDVRFCEDNSHETIIRRLGLDDSRPLATRGWVRVECVPPFAVVRVDETSAPGWWDAERAALEDRVRVVAERVAPVRATYDAEVAPALATYNAAVAAERATYDAATAPALATYNADVAQAQATYDAATAQAQANCRAATDVALATYNAEVAPALATYRAAVAAAQATYRAAIASIEGFAPERT